MHNPYDNLKDRVAVVTGAASGIGRETAVALAEVGVRVVIGTFPGDPHDPKETLRRVESVGGDGVIHDVDVRSTSEVEAFTDRALTEWGRLDFAVANAGVLRKNAIAELDDAAWSDMLQVDLTGVMRTLRAAATRIDGPGSLISISSIAGGVYGWGEHAHYSAAKAGVLGLSRALAVELAPRGIRSNAIVPGLIETPQSSDPVNSLGPDGLVAAGAKIPWGRVGTAAEIATVIRFLVSDDSRYLTGQSIVVDGGLTTKMQD
ncbi:MULTISPECIES: SDR family NAD(P)-dependent oxidoreductase [Rhodococcus]|uniref:SDR family NAD(P)-dependent oxidoreductase n=1 Tax=Rhodococcus TaxID=1827 RepID=UPI0002A1F4F2|nr:MULTISPECIES: SDR family NAD(P)-dependent oxidoreductase [Rhodococcus]ELB89321.1 short-chain dehydrogenase/reductase sdr [Rhodococcus wratislaviensis IFP 2016]NHU43101.1 SDR family oxidoreductase [Rhodococcus sp. A14]MBA8958477.1 3-oxoacyl-[acyl-carrier protein] reductase [Rhodococcus opacus]MBP2204042.1 3-oxoacyl-[acyl-carrier protein] reductase [Rhodococcus opacus]MDI9938006.1 SDR family NAD(P)-dependent oxidoreductase [Rhodococcus sp. IEGM 1351]